MLGRLFQVGALTTAATMLMPYSAPAHTSFWEEVKKDVHNGVKAIGDATPKVNIGNVHIDLPKAAASVVNSTIDKTGKEIHRTGEHIGQYGKEPGRLIVDTVTAPITLTAQGVKDVHDVAEKNGPVGKAIAQVTEPANKVATVVSVNDQHFDMYLHDHRGTVNTCTGFAAIIAAEVFTGGGVTPELGSFVTPNVSRDKNDHWHFGGTVGLGYGFVNIGETYNDGKFSTVAGVGVPVTRYVNAGVSVSSDHHVSLSVGPSKFPGTLSVSTDNKLHTDSKHMDIGAGVGYKGAGLSVDQHGTVTGSYTFSERIDLPAEPPSQKTSQTMDGSDRTPAMSKDNGLPGATDELVECYDLFKAANSYLSPFLGESQISPILDTAFTLNDGYLEYKQCGDDSICQFGAEAKIAGTIVANMLCDNKASSAYACGLGASAGTFASTLIRHPETIIITAPIGCVAGISAQKMGCGYTSQLFGNGLQTIVVTGGNFYRTLYQTLSDPCNMMPTTDQCLMK
jgi:hypothetical protein